MKRRFIADFLLMLSTLFFLGQPSASATEIRKMNLSRQCAFLFDSKFKSYLENNFGEQVPFSSSCCDSNQDPKMFWIEHLLKQGYQNERVLELVALVEEVVKDGSFMPNKVKSIKFESSTEEVDRFLKAWYLGIRDYVLDFYQPRVRELNTYVKEIETRINQHQKNMIQFNLSHLITGAYISKFFLFGFPDIVSVETGLVAGLLGVTGFMGYKMHDFRSKTYQKYEVEHPRVLSSISAGHHELVFDEAYFSKTISASARKVLSTVMKPKNIQGVEEKQSSIMGFVSVLQDFNLDPQFFIIYFEFDPNTKLTLLEIEYFTSE